METRKNYWPVIVLLCSLLTATAVFDNWSSPARGYLTFGFLLFCPGLALGYLLPAKDMITRAFLVIVLSIGIDTVVAEAILYLGKWSPQLILVILIMICLTGVLFELALKAYYLQLHPAQRSLNKSVGK